MNVINQKPIDSISLDNAKSMIFTFKSKCNNTCERKNFRATLSTASRMMILTPPRELSIYSAGEPFLACDENVLSIPVIFRFIENELS